MLLLNNSLIEWVVGAAATVGWIPAPTCVVCVEFSPV